MIATDHQYRVTRSRIERFDKTLASLAKDTDELYRDLRIASMREQVTAMEAEIASYDRLRSGEVINIAVERAADLPKGLVQGRLIAGLGQDEFAKMAGIREAQLRRWERNGYSKVPLKTMLQIATMLPITVADGIGKHTSTSIADVRRALVSAGLAKEVIERVIVPDDLDDDVASDELDRRIGVLFGSSAYGFVKAPRLEASPLRFKLPSSAAQERTRAYAAYVDGICRMVAKTQAQTLTVLPQSWSEVRNLVFPAGEISLKAAIDACWSLGIGVIALNDRVAFHGACRRSGGSATIALKQPSRFASRWLFDLLHEIFHIVAEPEADFTLLEGNETSPERRASRDEKRANRFAALILTNGRYIEILAAVQKRAQGDPFRMRSVVTSLAREAGVPVGVLANLVAQNIGEGDPRSNWWPSATALQDDEDDPWKTVRDAFLRNANLGRLTAVERAMVDRLMETRDD